MANISDFKAQLTGGLGAREWQVFREIVFPIVRSARSSCWSTSTILV